jgi:D-amino-acid dehydrogenase
MKHAPLILRPRFDQEMIRWLVATLGNCTATAYARNKGRMVRLAEYSRDQLALVRAQTGICYDARTQGTLQLFRTQKQLDGVSKDIAVLQADGVPFEVLDAAGCIAAEPGLAQAAETFVGGLRLPKDETGDCYKFTTELAHRARDLGARFRFDEVVAGFRTSGDHIDAAVTNKGDVKADVFIAALGSRTPQVVAPLGLRLPVYPVKGYSITAPVTLPQQAPVSTIMDESYKVAITRLGDRIRVGGMAEVSGFDTGLSEKRRATLLRSATSLFPRAARWDEASFWSGLRPMTPDGTPVVGSTPARNLYLNTGHGTLGWTMACGSARILSDQISGVTPEIRVDDLAISRYRYSSEIA